LEEQKRVLLDTNRDGVIDLLTRRQLGITWLPAEYLYVNKIGVHQQAAKTNPQSAAGGNKTRKASRLKRW